MNTYSIIIVAYNAPKLVERCLRSIVNNGYLGTRIREVYVVNNSVEPVDTSVVPKEYLRVIQNDKNIGFGQAVNIAAKEAGASHLLLLNQDAELQSNTIYSLDKFLEENPDADVVGMRQLKHNGEVLSTLGNFPSVMRELTALTGISRVIPVGRLIHPRGVAANQYSSSGKRSWVSGGAMLVRRDKYMQVNGFDADYFMYVEDIDLCRRITDIGGTVWYCADAKVWHDGGQSDVQRTAAQEETTRGLIIYARKHGHAVAPLVAVERTKSLVRKMLS